MPHDADSPEAAMIPPVAPAIPMQRELHGQVWTDEYAWMSDHDSPDLAAYLSAERGYYDLAVGHLAHLSNRLFGEVEHRILPTDESVSWKRGDFFYYTRTVTGSEYEQFMSTRDPSVAGRVVLDETELGNKLGDSDGYVSIGVREPSPDGRLLAYSVDTTGDEVYALRFRDLTADRDLTVDDDLRVAGDVESVARTYYGGAWSADSTAFFYTVHDHLFRPYQVWRHQVGTMADTDLLLYTETDERYEVTVRASTSGEYIFVESANRDTSETWLVSATSADPSPILMAQRRRGIEYRVDHVGEHLYIVTNDGAPEFRLMRTPITAAMRPMWTEVAASRPGERLHACHGLAGRLLLELRREGFPLLRVVDLSSGTEHEIHSELPAGRIVLDTPLEYDTTGIVVKIESLVAPPRWYDVDLRSGNRLHLKSQHVTRYDPANYHTERRYALAPDGVSIPVTLAWRAGTPLDGSAPCVMWGYGAYESCDDPQFDRALPSLLDRGVVYALTHPRGGGELGRSWWMAGRLQYKPNTFVDHIAVADWLAGDQPHQPALVDGSRIVTRGLSAGGLLQGAVMSMRPDRWRAVVAEVPFVDVLNTMLDPSIPLTVNEWDEWGDPRQPEAFELMAAYSPYENVLRGRRSRGKRPALLVTGAVHDPRVMVHEPAKWVARLRSATGEGDGPLLFRVELGAGAHTGPAGRYAHYRYESEVYAFILEQLGLYEPEPVAPEPVLAEPLPDESLLIEAEPELVAAEVDLAELPVVEPVAEPAIEPVAAEPVEVEAVEVEVVEVEVVDVVEAEVVEAPAVPAQRRPDPAESPGTVARD
jgi:oligopeptidase B